MLRAPPTSPNEQITEPKSENQISVSEVSAFIGKTDFAMEVDAVGEIDFVEEVASLEDVNSKDEVTVPVETETGFNLFEQRQLQYFIGKKVEKDIVLDNAEVLRAGERITPDVVIHITTRSTLMEVTSHLQKN